MSTPEVVSLELEIVTLGYNLIENQGVWTLRKNGRDIAYLNADRYFDALTEAVKMLPQLSKRLPPYENNPPTTDGHHYSSYG